MGTEDISTLISMQVGGLGVYIFVILLWRTDTRVSTDLSKICFIHIAASVINEVTHRKFNIFCNIVVLLWQS